MSKAFKIKPNGKWDVPTVGKIDSREAISDEKLFALYKLRRPVFPWISLGPDAESYLKKQKLKKEDVASLVQNAISVEEVELLAKFSDVKAVASIVETKIAALKNKNK